MNPIPTALAVTQLIKYLVELKEQNEAGELTDEQFDEAWTALNVRRQATKTIWTDAKAQGGYS